MDVQITVETSSEKGEKRIHRLDGISRPYGGTCPEGFGLLLEDGERIVAQIQKPILFDQVEEINRKSRVCPVCRQIRAIHDHRMRALEALVGRFRIKVARLPLCSCDTRSAAFHGGPRSPLACLFP